MTHKTLSATVVATILLAAGATARAELSCPTAGSPEEATTLAGENFAAAQEAYEMGRPLRAMAHYQCSYRLRPHNSTLYNLGVLAEGIGETDVALTSYREYLERYPDGEERDEISRRLRELESRATPDEPPPTEPPPEEPPPEEPPPEEPPPEEPPPPAEPPPEEPPAGEGRVSTGRIMAFVTLGLGVAIGAVGGVFLGMASATNDELWSDIDDEERSRDQLVADSDWGWMQETVGWVLVATGAAAVAGSILLFVLAPARRPAESGTATRTTVAPFMTGDGGGLSLQGLF